MARIGYSRGSLLERGAKRLLDYCQEDVDATCSLAETMLNGISLPHALIRGRYMQSIALMERNGVPMDYKLLNEVISNWTSLKRGLIEKIDTQRIYRQGSFSEQRFEQYLRKWGYHGLDLIQEDLN